MLLQMIPHQKLFKKKHTFFAGYETLQQAVIYWEDGLMKLSFNEDRSKPAILVSKLIDILDLKHFQSFFINRSI